MGDLVVTVVGDYTVKNTQINGLNGAFGTINVQSNSESRFKFRLVKTGTDELLPVHDTDKILFSVYDLDAGKNGGGVAHEYCEFNTPVIAHKLTDTTTVATSGTNDHLKAWSTRSGTAADNPADPLKMSKIATDSKISVTYQGTAEWEFTYGSKGENVFKSEKNKRLGYRGSVRKTGRNLLFAGRSQGDCACVGVSHWKIQNNLVHNNLGGKGPNTAAPPELRGSDVFGLAPYSWAEVGPVDLVITVADGETYQPADGDGNDGAGKNGLWPVGHSDHQQMVGINIKCSTQTKFDFRFVKHGTDEPYTVSNTFFSLYDLDQSKESNDPGNHEYCEFPQGPDFHPQGWKTTADTQLKQSATDGETLKFESTEWGKLDDNPTDPTKLTELQKSRSVTVWYSATSHFQVTLGDYGPRCAAKGGGRNMLFAGPGIYCPAN